MTNLARRVLGDAAARAYANKLAAMTVSRRTFAIQDRAELSIAPGDQRQDRRGRIDRHHHRERSRRAVRVVHQERPFAPLQKDNVAGFLVSRTVFGGNANEYHSVLLLSSFADIDRGPAQVRLLKPPEAAAMAAKVQPHVEHVERTILRYVPDLSYRAKPTS
jgi:hypothetical protein